MSGFYTAYQLNNMSGFYTALPTVLNCMSGFYITYNEIPDFVNQSDEDAIPTRLDVFHTTSLPEKDSSVTCMYVCMYVYDMYVFHLYFSFLCIGENNSSIGLN